MDAAGNLLIADSRNDRIRMVAARTGTKAAAGVPLGVVAGSGGSVLFADAINNRIRMVSG